ncbi:MAG: fimbrillin family protein [Bacteroidales bacterium]|nr:fimbrillin family protein [Bacteroidales bacterium]
MKKSLLILFAAAAALVACNKEANVDTPSSEAVKFAVENINTYTVKAAIGDDSVVGLYAGAPIAAYDVAGTVSGSTITGAAINWTTEQVANDTPSDFWAVYPKLSLNDNTKLAGYEIKTADNVTYAEDVLIASATGKHSDANVLLSFKHPFAKVIFKVTNNIADDSVKEISVTGFSRKGDIDVAGGGAVSNLLDNADPVAVISKGTEGKVSTFETIVLPQEVAPVIVVTMNSLRTYTFILTAAYNFQAGKTATAEITVDGSSHGGVSPSSAPVAFAFAATDWITTGVPAVGSFGAAVGGGETGWWYVRGTIDGVSWGDFIPMAASDVNTWTKTINYTPDAAADDDSKGIKIVYINGGTTDWYGSATVPAYGTDPFLFEDITTSGPNIKLGEAGSYKLNFYSDNHHMHVEKLD